ncbi:MAG: hypothetical protein IIX48_04980 [Lachnospiraceae bacterium]|nr:hypothetical protein [Lachnospiraceae bacterium]
MKKKNLVSKIHLLVLTAMISMMLFGCGNSQTESTSTTATNEQEPAATEETTVEETSTEITEDVQEETTETKEENQETVEKPAAETGPYEFVQSGIEMNEENYNKYVEMGRSLKDKKTFTDYELFKMLAALSYQYDWAEDSSEQLAGVQEFMDNATYFWANMEPTSAALLSETFIAIDETTVQDGITDVLFSKYIDPSTYSGMELTYNDLLYTMYIYYINNVDDYTDTNTLLRTMQDKNNIITYPFMEEERFQYFDQLYLYSTIINTKYLIDNGYTMNHIFELKNPVKFFKASENGQEIESEIECKYVVPIIKDTENEKETRMIFYAFLDDNYKVANIISYNFEGETEVTEGEESFLAYLFKN